MTDLTIIDKEYADIFLYIVSVRRELHACPEVGFDLPKTVAIVCRELDTMGITYTDRYGKCSIVAEIGEGEDILALRADMDALPIEEKTELEYASKNKGMMHACGHDAHTAILLGVAKYLNTHKKDLKRRVRFIFQPAEESSVSGAKMMVDNGVMEGVGSIVCSHCENTLETGKIGVRQGDYMAACIPATVKFFGKTSHATLPSEGIDAIAMAVEAYVMFKEAVAECSKDGRYIWSVGRMSGGEAHNIIADVCEMKISFRFYDIAFAEQVREKVFSICQNVAEKYGGKIEIDWKMSAPPVHNDEKCVSLFEKYMAEKGIVLDTLEPRMSSEDFSWYLTKAPGMIFRFGTRNEAKGCTALAHNSKFNIDENGMYYAMKTFIAYVLGK